MYSFFFLLFFIFCTEGQKVYDERMLENVRETEKSEQKDAITLQSACGVEVLLRLHSNEKILLYDYFLFFVVVVVEMFKCTKV